MRAVKAFGPGDLRVVELQDPVPTDDEVLIRVLVCGVCGSDHWFWRVKEPTDKVAGHEVAGEVVALGPGVTQLQVGDRVAVNNVRGCGQCEACREGAFVRCPNGVTHMGRGFSELVVAPQHNCLLLAPDVSDEMGSLIFDLWGTPFAALERANVSRTDRVLVTGCGPIGLATVALAKLRGAHVYAVDPLPNRLDAAAKLGADVVLATTLESCAMHAALPADGVSVVVECSGQAAAYELALNSLSIGGSLVCVGEGAAFEFRPSEKLIHRHLSLHGSLYSTMQQGCRVQELMLERRIDALAFVNHRISLDALPREFCRIVQRDGCILKTIVQIA